MVLLNNFLSCFPIRFGVLVTSALVILEKLINLGFLLVYNSDDVKRIAENLKETVKDLSSFEYFDVFLEFVIKSKKLRD